MTLRRLSPVPILLLFCSLAAAEKGRQVAVRVEDGSGAVMAGAAVTLRCAGQPEVRYLAGADGSVRFLLGERRMCSAMAVAEGFSPVSRDLRDGEDEVSLWLKPLGETAEVTVSSQEAWIEGTTPTSQATLGQSRITEVPLFHRATGFTDLLTRTTPGVAADANGFAHPLGEHADTSISLDGQPITDQQAKVFSNQIDPATIASLTAITGAPPAEFGGKTSLVVTVTTRSGLGAKPAGTSSVDYGSFGTAASSLTLAAGDRLWGNFLALQANGSGRFLDTPEFRPMHDRGNSEGVFDRVDWQPNETDFVHLNLGAGRSWFQTPNSYDAAAAGQDQRSQIRSFNVALGWNHEFAPSLLAVLTPFVRHDEAQYIPSGRALADTTATLAQNRTFTNTGFRLETVYSRGAHTAKAGGTYGHTLLHEQFQVALTDPLYNAVCVDAAGEPIAAKEIVRSMECAAAGYAANPSFLQGLLPYDLTRGGGLYRFDRSADIAEGALYAQDDIKWGRWLLSPGVRYDIYNGLSRGRQVQPRVGLGYRTPWSGTLVRGSYARLYETPYNENLIFANEASASAAGANPFASYRSEPVRPGTRNQFNVGFEQRFGAHVSVDADYYWKFTNTAFDFDTLFNTPITFSVAWRKSKIDGLALRASLTNLHGLEVTSVMGHVRSRFFTPEVGGLIFAGAPASPVFRIDHGEEFEQTTDVRYRLPAVLVRRHRAWVGGTWRYNSGLALPDTIPTYLEALKLTGDEQAQMGLRCGAEAATPVRAIRQCSAAAFRSSRVRIPAVGTEDADRNPVRVAPRTLLDLSAGDDELLRMEKVTVGVHVAVQNAANGVALYNFLSTFSGTHFVPPRSVQAGFVLEF